MMSTTRREQIDRILADQRLWRDLVAEVGRHRMNEPGPMGEWTFKDLAAHLVAWRNTRIPMIEAVARGEPIPAPPWPPEMEHFDEINAWFHARDADRPLDDVLDDYDGSFDRLAAALEWLSDDAAIDPKALSWTDGTAAVDVDFTEHLHQEHLPSVRSWLASRS